MGSVSTLMADDFHQKSVILADIARHRSPPIQLHIEACLQQYRPRFCDYCAHVVLYQSEMLLQSGASAMQMKERVSDTWECGVHMHAEPSPSTAMHAELSGTRGPTLLHDLWAV